MSNGPDEEIPKLWSDLMWAIEERNFVRKNLPVADPSAPPKPPYDFHGFEIDGYRTGGMGMVLLGRDPALKRKVALKLLQSSGTEADAKLMAEAQALAKLSSHPNVVTVYSVHRWEGGVFFAMEFVDGLNGQEWLKRGPTWREVLGVFIDAGEGLAAAHREEMQHGDFKPANILIGKDGRTLVADFGIADYVTVDEDEAVPTGRRAGTPEYMAPERLRGQQGDARSDQYSFCASLWKGLHGSRAFRGKTVLQLLDAIEAGAIDPRTLDPEVPRWLTEVVRKGLAEDPDQRYRDMPELLLALKGGPPDDESATEEPDDDDESIEHEGRVLHAPATPAGAAPQRWGYFAAAAFSALAVLGIKTLARSPAPEPGTAGVVEAEPYTVILGLAAEDRFAEAQQTWSDHAADLSDEQSLQLAREWLTRARKHAHHDRTKAKRAASAALEVADRVAQHGGTPEAKKAGAQLAAEAKIYERIAADEFAEAQQAWLAHESELSDEQSLQLGEECLNRAEQLADVAGEKACAAASAAVEIATEIASFGVTEEWKEKGGQLVADYAAFQLDHPDVCRD